MLIFFLVNDSQSDLIDLKKWGPILRDMNFKSESDFRSFMLNLKTVTNDFCPPQGSANHWKVLVSIFRNFKLLDTYKNRPWYFKVFNKVFIEEIILFYPNIFGFSDFLKHNYFLQGELEILIQMEKSKIFYHFLEFR